MLATTSAGYDEMGGIVDAIEAGFPQREIAEASYHYQMQIDRGEKTVVGVNKYQTSQDKDQGAAPPENRHVGRKRPALAAS